MLPTLRRQPDTTSLLCLDKDVSKAHAPLDGDGDGLNVFTFAVDRREARIVFVEANLTFSLVIEAGQCAAPVALDGESNEDDLAIGQSRVRLVGISRAGPGRGPSESGSRAEGTARRSAGPETPPLR